MKVLNLYAGIGGNRKLWTDVEVTTVEWDKDIAAIYQDFFPDDKMVITDAHQYLLEHFKEFDFIWSSPPCPTHSRINNLCNEQEGKSIKYPDMQLYQEIIYLKHWHVGSFCIENVISYYNPLITPVKSGSHYYWTNFTFKSLPNITRNIRRTDENHLILADRLGFDLSKYNLSKYDEKNLLANCVEPEHGLHILECARGNYNYLKQKQEKLF